MGANAPKGTDWADIVEVLHGLVNTMTVRTHYSEGHPAIQRADDMALAGFARVLDRLPEIVVALIDGEFVVCERPMPDLREKLHILGDGMLRHDVECLVFQRGVTSPEITILGRTLTTSTSGEAGGRARDIMQAHLTHILLRFAHLRTQHGLGGTGTSAFHFVPYVVEVLTGVVHSLAADEAFDTTRVLQVAKEIVTCCRLRAFTLTQRCWTRGMFDAASHATNVAMMAAAMALDAGYPEATGIDVASAAILHDTGHLLLPEDLRGMPEPLLTDERARTLFRNHTFAGASALLSGGAPPLWVAAALEHHRGVDGGGYPTLDSKAAPHELVRMVTLANYFDRKRTLLQGRIDEPDEVLRSAGALADRYFGPALVERFIHALGVFPPGTTVELSDRQPAMVLSANSGDPWRPQVLLLLGPNAGRRVDLKELSATEGRHHYSIVRAIPPPLFTRADVMVKRAQPKKQPADASVALAPEIAAIMTSPREVLPTETSEAKAKRELSHMGDLLEDLLKVSSDVLVSAPSLPPIVRMPLVQHPLQPPAASAPPPVAKPAPPPPPPPEDTGKDTDPAIVMRAPRVASAFAEAVAASSMASAPPPSPPTSAPAAPRAPSAAPKRPPVALPPTPKLVTTSRPPVALPPRPKSATNVPSVSPRPPSAAPPVTTERTPAADALTDEEQVYLVRLGPLASVPTALPMGAVLVDHRSGFLLTFVDGYSTLQEIIDASGLPRLEVLKILAELRSKRAIDFPSADRR